MNDFYSRGPSEPELRLARAQRAWVVSQTCEHRDYTTQTACFTGPVSRDENRSAHGNVCDTDTCIRCGAVRVSNVNGRHVETDGWSDAPVRLEWERAQAAVQ